VLGVKDTLNYMMRRPGLRNCAVVGLREVPCDCECWENWKQVLPAFVSVTGKALLVVPDNLLPNERSELWKS